MQEHGKQITQVHFHCGPAGDNGPVVVNFLSDPTCPDDNSCKDFNGLFEKGQLVADDSRILANTCTGGFEINTLASLYQAMLKGLIYLNVHDADFPDGVVRGQIFTTPEILF
jgi:hypothetical protein